ncbi:COX assembly mitochondrial protein [Melia azedarach]|uniref:COX assembly mitochondrial protein n=1 Tax=Melia azedarach TaxID=155640 RepID=A0ACC1WTN8_MELAZ|nr:COX assembly mitochondrial protein [Melia azedarach]
MAGEATTGGCEKLHKALCECHRRVASGPVRESVCRHLNRSLAECLVAEACPEESEAVRSLCSSGGTALKRSQCQQAQLSLSVCLSSHTS